MHLYTLYNSYYIFYKLGIIFQIKNIKLKEFICRPNYNGRKEMKKRIRDSDKDYYFWKTLLKVRGLV